MRTSRSRCTSQVNGSRDVKRKPGVCVCARARKRSPQIAPVFTETSFDKSRSVTGFFRCMIVRAVMISPRFFESLIHFSRLTCVHLRAPFSGSERPKSTRAPTVIRSVALANCQIVQMRGRGERWRGGEEKAGGDKDWRRRTGRRSEKGGERKKETVRRKRAIFRRAKPSRGQSPRLFSRKRIFSIRRSRLFLSRGRDESPRRAHGHARLSIAAAFSLRKRRGEEARGSSPIPPQAGDPFS